MCRLRSRHDRMGICTSSVMTYGDEQDRLTVYSNGFFVYLKIREAGTHYRES